MTIFHITEKKIHPEMKAVNMKKHKRSNSFTAKSPNAQRVVCYTSQISQKGGQIASIRCMLKVVQGIGILNHLVVKPVEEDLQLKPLCAATGI